MVIAFFRCPVNVCIAFVIDALTPSFVLNGGVHKLKDRSYRCAFRTETGLIIDCNVFDCKGIFLLDNLGTPTFAAARL